VSSAFTQNSFRFAFSRLLAFLALSYNDPRRMSDIQNLRLVRWERIRRQGIWHFVFVRWVLGAGLPGSIIIIIFDRVTRKDEALAWYLMLGLCLVVGIFWGLAMWFVTMWMYSRALKIRLAGPKS
jgi:hypothetical protein